MAPPPPRRLRALDADAARRVAQSLVRASGSWARTFLREAGCPEEAAVAGLRQETVAFALHLLEREALPPDCPQRESFLAVVRHECAAGCRPPGAADGLLALLRDGIEPGDRGNVEPGSPVRCGGGSGAAPVAEEVFREFCRATGLGADTLVGRGTNLASLVFYIVLHRRIAEHGPVRREAIARLLRSARQCRMAFRSQFAEWLAQPGGWRRLKPDTRGSVGRVEGVRAVLRLPAASASSRSDAADEP